MYLKMFKWSVAKKCRPFSHLFVVSEVFENSFVDHPKKCYLFSDIQYVLGCLIQLLIVWQLNLVELLG